MCTSFANLAPGVRMDQFECFHPQLHHQKRLNFSACCNFCIFQNTASSTKSPSSQSPSIMTFTSIRVQLSQNHVNRNGQGRQTLLHKFFCLLLLEITFKCCKRSLTPSTSKASSGWIDLNHLQPPSQRCQLNSIRLFIRKLRQPFMKFCIAYTPVLISWIWRWASVASLCSLEFFRFGEQYGHNLLGFQSNHANTSLTWCFNKLF